MIHQTGWQHEDLTQKSSERNGPKATEMARELESDDVNEETGLGKVPGSSEKEMVENKVSTSLDDE